MKKNLFSSLLLMAATSFGAAIAAENAAVNSEAVSASANVPPTAIADNHSNQASVVGEKERTKTTTKSTKKPDMSKNSPKSLRAQLQLEQKDVKLFAKIHVLQAENTDGNIRIVWTAPEKSACKSSEYTLPYHNTSYHTNAYRTVAKTCTGEWAVSVLDENNQVLVKDNFTVGSSMVSEKASEKVAEKAEDAAKTVAVADQTDEAKMLEKSHDKVAAAATLQAQKIAVANNTATQKIGEAAEKA